MRLTLGRTLPIIISGVVGVLVIIGYFQHNVISDGLLEVAQLVTVAGVLLGVAHLLGTHLRRMVRGPRGRGESAVLIVGAALAFGLELARSFVPDVAPFANDLLRYVYQPLAGSIMALLTFFALRAAWRALQVRPAEALVIVIVGAGFLLAGGPWARLVPGLAEALEWTRAYPVMGVARGLLLGVGLGAIVASIRLLLGFDQPYLDR